ncbi:hypothetical protein KQ51_01120 [Candidatus Izimaplasma bacterium HR1]|jgi:hypothetical protein|nr:hypothetical protein KQ51_01120 [Candidatus Izimaplasma bacterium HR1]
MQEYFIEKLNHKTTTTSIINGSFQHVKNIKIVRKGDLS